MNKLQKRIREVEDEHAEEVLNDHLAAHDQTQRDNALILLGRIQATDRISATLSSEVIRALEQIEETKAYKSLGYARFVDYLNDANMSPLSKSQFYEGKKIIANEGDVIFNALTSLGIPLSQRKMLGKGKIQIDGNTIFVKDDDGNESSVNIDDRRSLLEMLKTISDSSVQNREKFDNEKKKVERLEKKIADFDESLKRERAAAQFDALDSHSTALMNLINAFQLLKTEAGNLTLVEKEQFASRTFETIARQLDALSVAYNRASTLSIKAENIAADNGTEHPHDQQVRLHKEAVKAAQAREKQKHLQVVEPDINDDELADLMD